MTIETIADQFTSNAGIGSAVARHAQSYDIDIAPICSALDIDLDDLQSLTGRVSLDRLCRLLEACAVLSKDEAFGLKCAEIFRSGSSGPFGYGVMSAPTVRHLLQFIGNHTPYISQTSLCTFEQGEAEASVAWTFSPLIVSRDQYVDLIMALHLRQLRRIVGDDIDAVTINLERPRPQNPAIFRERMTRQIHFDMQVNSLHIPNRLLNWKNPQGDEKLFELMDGQCRAFQREGEAGEAFVDQVRRYIRLRIAEPVLSLEDVAAYFKLSERTFQRRLADLGTTLNDLRDEERRGLSLALLTESDLSISAICYRLGYSAPSAFTRSVHRWFGASPRLLRERGGGGATSSSIN